MINVHGDRNVKMGRPGRKRVLGGGEMGRMRGERGGGRYPVSNAIKMYLRNYNEASFEGLRGPMPFQCDVNPVERCLV